jgi:hypothetical protein
MAWAFGFFPNLLFVAFSDFSFGRRFTGTQEIVHRHPSPDISYDTTLQDPSFESNNGADNYRLLGMEDYEICSIFIGSKKY